MLKRLVLIMFGFNINAAFTSSCPPSPLKTAPKVQASVKFDSKTKLYSYTYEFKNEKEALVPILFFRLILENEPSSIEAPAGGSATYFNNEPEAPLPKNLTVDPVTPGTGGLLPNKTTGKYSFKK